MMVFHISSYYDKLSVNLLVFTTQDRLKKNAHLPKGSKGKVWMKEREEGKQGCLQKKQVIV